MRLLLGLAAVAGLLFAPALEATDGPFRVSPDSEALRGRPELRERLLRSPHGYFRFLSTPFAREVCRVFADVPDLPEASLHGDAHVEQYAVTSLGRGLTDFDDANRGPFVLDLVRFGVSLELAARERGWPEEAKKSLDAFLAGYRHRLRAKRAPIPTPQVVLRIRSTFRMDHGDLLRRADAAIAGAPVPLDTMGPPFHDYVARTLETWSGIPESFFALKSMGALRMGIGSALDEKYLLRVEGWTTEDADDVVLEAKEVREAAGIPCLRHGSGPGRVIDGNALIAYQPFPFSGLLHTKAGKSFWVHAWPDDYQELGIGTSLASPRELREVSFDVGVQLGRAHPAAMNVATREKDRQALLDAAKRHAARIRAAVGALTGQIESAWREFRDGASRGSPP